MNEIGMEDFENLYNERIQSFQDNEICDMILGESLRNPNFVALLKSLYEIDEIEDKYEIYSKCFLQGFRVCDLQKALCLLRDEFYDGTSIHYPLIEKNYRTQNSLIEKKQSDNIENKEQEEYYFSIKLCSEEVVGDRQINMIKMQSNLFSVGSILNEIIIFFGCNIDESNILTTVKEFEIPCLDYRIDEKINIDRVDVTAKQNEKIFYCNDIEKLGYLYYLICSYTNNLYVEVVWENYLRQLRLLIAEMNEMHQDIWIDKIVNDDSIVEKCKSANISQIKDFIIYKPTNIFIDELNDIITKIKQIDNVMPDAIFRDWVYKLPPRELYVIKNRYLGGKLMTLEEVGEMCNVSRERIRQVENSAVRNMLAPKRNKYRRLLNNKLKLLSQHKSFITIQELEDIGLQENTAIFLDKIVGDIIYDRAYNACFFSRASIDGLDRCLQNLPDEFTKEDLEVYGVLISDELNNAFLPAEVNSLICSKFRVYGQYITKSKITLKVVLSFLMQKYFPNGMDIYEDENIEFLRVKAHEEFDGYELAENNRAIRARLQAFCILVGRGIWMYDANQILISNNLRDSIIDYIQAYKSPVLPIQAILDFFSDELNEVDISNKYSLHGQLKKILPSVYSINRDYVFKSGCVSFYEIVEAYVKQSTMPVTKRDIQNNFPGITDIVIQQVATATKVINMNGYYVHLDNLNISDVEINTLKELVDAELSDMEIHHSNSVFSKIKGALSGLFGRIGVTHYLQFYYLLREIYPNDYEYNRPFIGALGVEVISGEAQVINIILKQDECSIAMMRQYAREVGTVIDRYIEFIDRNNDSFIFKNRDFIISTSAAGTDDVNWTGLDAILSDFMQDEQYKLLSEFYNFRELPDLRCTWNTWLLYSIVRKYSQEFKLTLTSHFLNEAKPILVRRDYDEQNIDLEVIAKMDTGDAEQFGDSDDEMLDDFDYDDLE